MLSPRPRSALAWLSVPALLATALLAGTASSADAARIGPTVAVPATEYVVPAGVTSIRVTLVAAAGLDQFCQLPGRGGAVSATIPVTPGETLQYNVGNYFAPSASGNSTDIRRAPYTLADRLVVAGGGGSNADLAGLTPIGNCSGVRTGPGLGGDGGSPAGLAGTGEDPGQCTFFAGHPGGGGQLDGPGAGGTTCGPGGDGAPGVFGFGGVGGGSGTAVAPCSQGGRGGEGWYGGGGGGGTGGPMGSPGGCTDAAGMVIPPAIGGGGGGGSSFAEPSATDVVYTVGANASSAGSVQITTVTAAESTTLSLKARAVAVVYGATTTLSGVLRTAAGAAVPTQPVHVLGRPAGAASFSAVATATTSATGVFSLSVKPVRGTTYVASFAGGAGLLAGSSATVLVSVRPRVSFALSDATATRGQAVVFSGLVTPKAALQTVLLQRRVGSTWVTVRSTKLSAASAFAFPWRPTTSVDYLFRVLVPARTGYLAAVTVSKLLTVA